MKIVVLMGGCSPERDVSIASGSAIYRSLRRLGHDVLVADYGADFLGGDLAEIEDSPDRIPPDITEIRERMRGWSGRFFNRPEWGGTDLVFNALHGGEGEDGTVQGYLGFLDIRYTGSGLLSSALAMNKNLSKILFQTVDVPTPPWLHFTHPEGTDTEEIKEALTARDLDFPLIVKPNAQGSTVGVSIVKSEEALRPAVEEALRYDSQVIVETFIEGRELTAAILDDILLPVLEIVPKSGLYDYECKYTSGMSDYRVPAELDPKVAIALQQSSERAYHVLQCRGYARIDFRMDADGNFYCLEVNTLPGMTSTSLVPKAAGAVGIDFDELIEKIVSAALS